VIELATGIPRTEFAGGEQVNKPLRALGFLVKTVEPQDPDGKVADAVQTTFTLERDLQSALRSNIGQLEEGMKIVDGGSEKTVDSGHVDITVVDKDGSTVVIELKAGEADRKRRRADLGLYGRSAPHGRSNTWNSGRGEFHPSSHCSSECRAEPPIENLRFPLHFWVRTLREFN